ncbi:MAG: glycoside hydrolase family 9 protein [Kiritimatiellae bacterium]|nr:glycoside hydrolase family 9 protein [Kiritimatiellia bacterium]
MPLLCLLLLAGCTVRAPEETPRSEMDRPPREVTPPRPAAVLMVEDNLEFVADSNFPGGVAGYRAEVEGLARLLNEHGVGATVEAVNDWDTTLEQLAQYRVLYVADSNGIHENLRKLLEAYVRAGGVLVGIGEVGRYPGEWAKAWPFSRLFGLLTRVVDRWGTGVTWEGEGLYRLADITAEDPLVEGLGRQIDWGPKAQVVWATVPSGAKVLAVFPEHVVQLSESETPSVVAKPIPAVATRRLERGTAIFISVLPGGRDPAGWQDSGDTGRLLANAAHYANETLVLPPVQYEVVIGRNQLAYEPDWPKSIVIRVIGAREAVPGRFRLIGGRNELLGEGELTQWPSALWKSAYLYKDLSSLTRPGSYQVEVSLPTIGQRFMIPLRIAENMMERELLPTQMHFLREMRCGVRCHTRDPVVGGHHDATGDWAVRMWSMPHVVWALALYFQEHPGAGDIEDELRWALDWCLKMQAPDGGAYASVRPPDDHSGGGSPIHMRPSKDTMVRELESRYSYEYTATYAAGLARAAAALQPGDKALADRALEAARRAFERLDKDTVYSTADIGNKVWAATELYQATDDKSYLDRVRGSVPTLLERQLKPGRVSKANIYGDFFADPRCTTFNDQQWKVFHAIGIYFGLIQFQRALDPASPLRADVAKALKDLAEGYLLGMSALTPHYQMANALEPGKDGKFEVYHFSHRGAWVRNHGLNCDMLAMATVALEIARDLGPSDAALAGRLRRMAAQQINWLLGDNPLGYSMVTGLGQREAPLPDDKLGTGHIKGGIPNGIIGQGPHNYPAWGVSWGSREYWLPHNAYLISTMALLDQAVK